MADFWKTIENKYFGLIDSGKLSELKNVNKNYQSNKDDLGDVNVPRHFIGLINNVIKPEAFEISNEANINNGNKKNFIASSYINVVTYGNLMAMKNKNTEPCDKCLGNFESIMVQKFDINSSKRKSKKGIENHLNNEYKNLEKCIKMKNFGFCDSCLRISTGFHQTSLIAQELKNNREKLKLTNIRAKYLIGLLNKKCKAEDRVKFAINVSLEANLIKSYLFSYLLELEQKLLADNVYNIVGKSKNILIIEFIRIQGVYIINCDPGTNTERPHYSKCTNVDISTIIRTIRLT